MTNELRMVSGTQELGVAQDHTATAHKQVNTELLWLQLGVGQWDPEPRPLAPTLSSVPPT